MTSRTAPAHTIACFALTLSVCFTLLTSGAAAGSRLPKGNFAARQQALETRLLAADHREGVPIRRTLAQNASSGTYVRALMEDEFIRAVGADNLDKIRANEQGKQFLRRFMGDTSWMGMFLASGPLGKDPARCLRILLDIWQFDPACTKNRHEKTIAMAVALEYGRHDWPVERARNRYAFYRDSRREQRLHPVYDNLKTWEKRWLAGHGISMHGGEASQRWLRDNVKLPIQRYTGACWQVPYRSYNCFGDTVQSWTYYFPFQGSFPSFSQMTRFVGGVCGRLSGYGAAAAVANGIPATTMGEPGHCAYAVRLGRGKWTPAYSLSWKRGVHVNLYGSSWQMLVLTDRMMSDADAWRKATVHRWQAHLHEEHARALDPASASASRQKVRDDTAIAAAFTLAVKAQRIHYPAWNEFGSWLASGKKTSGQSWREFHEGVLAGLAKDFPYIAWKLISTYAYPAIVDMNNPNHTIKLFRRFHRALDGWGAGRWPVESVFDTQWKALGDNEDAAFAFFRKTLAVHRDSEAYLGPLLTWGFGRFGQRPEQRQRFFDLVAAASAKAKTEPAESKAILDMASAALTAAEKDRDADMYRTVGHMIDQAAPPPAKPIAERKEFPGELLSEGALTTFGNLSKRWDKPAWRHWFLGSRRPGFFHSDEVENPWVELELRHYGDLSGIVIVNRETHQDRAVPLRVTVSTDGKTWREVAILSQPKPRWSVDLQGKKIRAKRIRVTKQGKGFLHLRNIRVYGRRSS